MRARSVACLCMQTRPVYSGGLDGIAALCQAGTGRPAARHKVDCLPQEAGAEITKAWDWIWHSCLL